MISHRVAIETHSYDPDMVNDPETVIVEVALSCPVYYRKTNFLRLLSSRFSVLADHLDAEGFVDEELTTRDFDIFNLALRTIQPLQTARQ